MYIFEPTTARYNIAVMQPRLYNSTHYKWMLFFALGLGSVTNVAHHGSVGIALPTIAQFFGVSLTTVQWVVLAESLTISAMLLPMGRLSDMIGRKSMYITGITLFGLTSFLTGISPALSTSLSIGSPIVLIIIFRIFQGLGASMTQATGMAMITTVFSNEERGKGLGAHGAIIGTGGIIGPIIGGFLITYVGWQWVFWINVPLCALTFIITIFLIDPARFNKKSPTNQSYDWIGAGLSTTVLLTFLITLSSIGRIGLFSFPMLAGILIFIATLVTFIRWELNNESPILDLGLFNSKLFSIGIVTNYLSFLGVTSFRFLIPFYLQAALKLTPAQISLVLIPNAVSRIILGPISGNISDHFGTKIFTTVGLGLCAAGLYLMALMGESTSVFYVVLSILIFSTGSGIFMSPNNAAIFKSSNQDRHGIVSGLVNLSRNAGNVTGIAITTATISGIMFAQGYSSDVEAVLGAGEGSQLLKTFISGMKTVYMIMGTIQVLSAMSHLLVQRPNQIRP
ncbi:MAG: MFS transporter [Dehalococcoidia bacterium]